MVKISWLRSTFVRSAGFLVGGSAFSQLIIAAAMPISTRLYSPDEFGVFAVFSGLVATLAVAACLRFEIAIPLPSTEQDAANLAALAAGAAVAMSLIATLLVTVFGGVLSRALNQPALEGWLWLMPVALLLAGLQSALQFWHVRKSAFQRLAVARVAQALAGSTMQIGAGVAGASWIGLVAGQIGNFLTGVLALLGPVRAQASFWHGVISRDRLRQVMRDYARFPKYSVIEALCNSASIQLPVVMIAALAAGSEAGHVALAMAVVQGPMSLLGNAISQVYLSRAPAEYHDGQLGPFTGRVIAGLARVGTGPMIFAAITAPLVFPWIFGGQWVRAGELITWMVPWFIAQLLTSPVSMALHIAGRQKSAMVLQAGGLMIRTGLVWGAHEVFGSYEAEAYAISGFIFYGVYLLVVARSVGVPWGSISPAVRSILLTSMAWVIAGAIAVIAASALRA